MQDENEEYECPVCDSLVGPTATVCPNCGYEFGSDEEIEDDL